MKKSIKLSFIIISAIAILCLSLAYIPFFQNFAVSTVERLKNDDINDIFWKQQMFAFASLGILFLLILNSILFTKTGKKLFEDFINSIKNIFNTVKSNKKYLFILCGLYLFGYCSIIRANFWNIANDDLARQLEGCRDWVNFYRYISEFGSIFLHTSKLIFDIAPLTQFIALFFIALASFFTISIFSDNNFSIKLTIASLPIGLFPYFLSNYAYRYDSPYMAFSLCVCIIPFLFYKDFTNYIISSILCLFLMCISYQASSGIYIFMAVLVFLKMLLLEKKDSKTLFKFTLTSIICYAFTLLFFSFLFMEPNDGGTYVDESMNLSRFIPNTITYISTLYNGLGKSSILIFSILIIFSFIFACTKVSLINKITTFFVVSFASIFCVCLSFGSYLALARPEFIPRACVGIGVLIGSISVFTLSLLNNNKSIPSKLSLIIAFYLSYSCIAFSFGFGNAEYDQKEYIRFRASILAQDLSECITEPDDEIELLFVNNIGYASTVEVIADVYPVAKEMIDIGFIDDRKCQFILESFNLISLKDKPNHYFKDANFPVVKDTAYHTIQNEDNKYLITFKNPHYKTIKTRRFIDE
jgi:hypothetical protein